MKNICIYCGSSGGSKPAYTEAAIHCGRTLAERGLTIVYGGGNIGLMGKLADAALEAGGQVIGVIPHSLVKRELAHHGVTSLITVHTMHERKMKMAELADGFIALPGGIGTLEEVFEVFTWLQLGIHAKPVGLLNVAGYYDRLIDFLRHMQADRFLRAEHFEVLFVEDDLGRLLGKMDGFAPKPTGKWLDRPVLE